MVPLESREYNLNLGKMMTLQLENHSDFDAPKAPTLLIIMDGVGIGRQDDSNAVFVAKTPVLDKLMKGPLYREIAAHGVLVGLPSDEDMGNSEIGHNVLGAGRIFSQGAKRVNEAFKAGDVFGLETWQKILKRAKDGGTVHFIGLFSDANVHSNISHLKLMLENLQKEGCKSARVHPLLDGRDVGEKTALTYIEPFEEYMAGLRDKGLDVRFASGGGRMNVTMDRYEADWDIVERGWKAHVLGEARGFKSAAEAVQCFYDEGMVDQYADPFVIVDDNGEPIGKMKDGDAAILFNFRGDRAIELSKAFDAGDDFDKFDRGDRPDVFYAGMMEYDSDAKVPQNFLVTPPVIRQTVSEYLCSKGLKSFAVSETQKFGHVTYFWNGNRSGKINKDLEDYVEVPSDKITFEKKPEMKAYESTDEILKALDSGKYDFLRINLANGDMVGHTGVFDAAVKAMEVVDECVGKMIDKVKSMGGTVIVTADHGNADEMFTVKKGEKSTKTSHTLNKVPFSILPSASIPELKLSDVEDAGLANVGATLMYLLGYQPPADYQPKLIEKA